MIRFLLSGVLLVAAAWTTGAAISAAMVGDTERLITFVSWTIAALAFFGVARLAGTR